MPLRIEPDLIYGHKHGMALVLDVFRPERANGAGVIFIQSGGWHSVWRPPTECLPRFEALLEAGFTVFSVWHGSAPKYAVPEAYEDVRRAVRWVKRNCVRFGVNEAQLGIYGTSAGGHLTLLLASRSDPGNPESDDPVLRQDNHVAAVVAFYPPVDLRGSTTAPAEILDKVEGLRDSFNFETALETEVSPILHVTPAMPPTLLVHGDADVVVPIQNSIAMSAKLQEQGVESDFITIPGGGHPFLPDALETAVPAMVDWFKRWLS